jgi:RNA-directed DNA polymerase
MDERRVIDPPDPDQHLLERIIDHDNLLAAWKRVKANRGSAGIGGVTVDEFAETAREQWPDIRASPLAGTYQPLPVRRVEILAWDK